MAALWSVVRIGRVRRTIRRAVLALVLISLAGCTELAQSTEPAPAGAQLPCVSLTAQYLQANMKDRDAYDGFEISPLRCSIAGWTWLARAHFHDHGHLRTYALFIQNDTITDVRFAVETDACAAQIYSQFDVATGELGWAVAPVQPALY
jgi:hypothetical protein